MALSIPSLSTSFGITLTDAYGLITDFRFLADRRIEVELSLWKDEEACGLALPRIASQVHHISPGEPSYDALFGTVASAVYGYLAEKIEGAEDVPSIIPGSLIPVPADQPV